jgi:hypothetical protein
VALGVLASAAHAGSELGIRLVEANSRRGGMGPGLEDVAGLLRENLPFNTFRLVSSGALRLPARGSTADLGSGLAVTCSGSQRNLSVTVTRGRRPLLRTTVALRDDRPWILGGFPGGDGKLIVILLAR